MFKSHFKSNNKKISGRRVSSYREVEESVGLLAEDSDNNDTDDEVVCINGFDVIAPISLQVRAKYSNTPFNDSLIALYFGC